MVHRLEKNLKWSAVSVYKRVWEHVSCDIRCFHFLQNAEQHLPVSLRGCLRTWSCPKTSWSSSNRYWTHSTGNTHSLMLSAVCCMHFSCRVVKWYFDSVYTEPEWAKQHRAHRQHPHYGLLAFLHTYGGPLALWGKQCYVCAALLFVHTHTS